MESLFWLLLPIAALSGWLSAKSSVRRSEKKSGNSSIESSNGETGRCIEGLNFLLTDQSDKAIELFTGSVDLDDETVETHLIMGGLFRRRGEVDRAIKIHQNLISRPSLTSSQKRDAMLQLGIDYLKAGLLDRAEAIFLELIDSGETRVEVFRYLRNLYEQEREWLKAAEMSERLMHSGGEKQQSRIAHYHCEQAEILVQNQEFDEARATISMAIQHDPECVRALIQCGDLSFKEGQHKAALKSFRKALNSDRHFSPLVLKRLFELFMKQGDLEAFCSFVKKYSDWEEDAAARFFLVTAFLYLGDNVQVDSLLYAELQREEASPYIVKSYLEKMRDSTEGHIQESFSALERLLEHRLTIYSACQCNHCGFESNQIFWQCPSCQNWGTVRPYQYPLEYTWLDN